MAKELAAKRMIGPFEKSPFPYFCVSPLGAREKKEPGKYRIIHDLSAPKKGVSVNGNIAETKGSVSYADIPAAVRLIQQQGQGCVLAKTDIEHAYKLLPIHKDDIPALGIRWQGNLYFDCTLPMGCRTGCKLFEIFSTALEFIAWEQNCGPLCHILDDFLMVTPHTGAAKLRLARFQFICKKLGVPLSEEKTEWGTCLTFLGILLDTIRMQASLPEDKLKKCRDLITRYLCEKKITVKQLESLTGVLNFACQVVVPGRPFLRRLYQLLSGVRKKPYFKIKLTSGAKNDLRMWLSFFNSYNGVSMFLPNEWTLQSSLHFYTDASKTIGYGIVFGKKWALGVWPKTWKTKKHDICLLEFYPILIAFKLFAKEVANTRVLIHTTVFTSI